MRHLSFLEGGEYEMASGLVPNDAVAWFVCLLQGIIPNRAAPTNAPAHRIKTAVKESTTGVSGHGWPSIDIPWGNHQPPLILVVRRGIPVHHLDSSDRVFGKTCRSTENNCSRSQGLVKKSRIPKR